MIQEETVKFANADSCWKTIMSDVRNNRDLLSVIEKFTHENTDPAKIVFGTSGWRGVMGSDFTFNNVRIVTESIIEMFKGGNPDILSALGVGGIDEVRRRGVIVGHDNRFLGRDFAMEVIGLLHREGIRTWYAGEAPTPQFSAAIEMIQAACSINITPSHNPANYAGFKFNPDDGGPAGSDITAAIENSANGMMAERRVIEPSSPGKLESIDLNAVYIDYINERRTIDLGTILDFVKKEDCVICIDNVHGATRGCMEKMLGTSGKIVYLRTEDDYLFGGIAPEPSEKNMEGVEGVLGKSTAQFRIGAIMDPDGDRIRLSDGTSQIPMNYFGAMALHFLHIHKGITGVVAKSVGTSNLVNAISEKLGIEVRETKVGFKNFRPYMQKSSPERAIVAFEESDGITGYNHTLEKDAMFGLLLAIEMVAVTGRNLTQYLEDIMDEFGHYYPDRSGISVDPLLVGQPLVAKLSSIRQNYRKGTKLEIGGEERTVQEVITVDGTKLVFDDGSWLMIRPSGTEPKVRFYIEARTREGKKAVFETAERMTKEALEV